MPGYIVLGKWTQPGRANLKQGQEQRAQQMAAAEKAGIHVVGVWVTMGEYDVVAVVDAPDEQTLAIAMLAAGGQGDLITQTMRAFSEEEFAQIVSKLP